MRDLLGHPLEFFKGKQLWELGFLEDKSLAQRAFVELEKEGYIRYEDLPLKTKLGESISVEFICNVYHVGDQRVVQCNIRDITDRKSLRKNCRRPKQGTSARLHKRRAVM